MAEQLLHGEPHPGNVLIHRCRILMWALFTTWRWRHHDQLPDGHYWRIEGLNRFEQDSIATD